MPSFITIVVSSIILQCYCMNFCGYSSSSMLLLTYCTVCDFFSLFNNPLGFLQDHFVLVVSEFMYIPWKHAQKLAASRASLQEGSSCTPSITVAAAENFESHIVQYVKGEV